MTWRKYISSFAVLLASVMLFAHAMIPHHHHAEHLGICLEVTEWQVADGDQKCCHHHGGEIGEEGGVHSLLYAEPSVETGCTGCHAVGCNPTLPLMLNHSAEFGSELLPGIAWMTLFARVLAMPEGGGTEAEYLQTTEARLISEYVLEHLPRRAPPMG